MASDVQVSFGANWNDLKQSVDEMNSYIKGMAVSTAVTAGATGGSAVVSAVKAAYSQIQALMATGGEVIETQTNLASVMKATGEAAGFTMEQMKDLADEIQRTTKFEDEAIIKAETMISTYTNVRGDEFKRVIQLGADMAQVMGGDVASSAAMLGKALDAPLRGMMMLSRQGIRFTEDEQSVIERMVEMNDIVGAQGKLLEKVAGQYGGAAKAAAEAKGGGLTQLKNILDDIYESVGVGLVNMFSGNFLPLLKKGAEYAKSWAEEFEHFGEVVGDTMSWIGDTVGTWVSFLWDVWSGIITNMSDLFENTFGTTVSDVLSEVWEYAKATFTVLLRAFVGLITAFQVGFNQIPELAKFAFYTVTATGVTMFNTITYYLIEVIPAYLTWFFDNWKEIFTDLYNATKTIFSNMWDNIIDFFVNVWAWLDGDETDFKWKGLLTGFESTLKELPKIAEREIGPLEQTLWRESMKHGGTLANAFKEQYQKNLKALGLDDESIGKEGIGGKTRDKDGNRRDPGDRVNYADTDNKAQFEDLQALFKRIQSSTASMNPDQQRAQKHLDVAEEARDHNKRAADAAEQTAEATRQMAARQTAMTVKPGAILG